MLTNVPALGPDVDGAAVDVPADAAATNDAPANTTQACMQCVDPTQHDT